MEYLFILIVVAIIVLLLWFILKNNKQDKPSIKEDSLQEESVEPRPNINGTVLDFTALSKLGYGDLGENCPINPPYSFYFFIVKYRTLGNKIYYTLAVSRGFEYPRIVKLSYYDEIEDFTVDRIDKLVNRFNMFTDDKEFNNLVCKHRKENIIEIIRKL